jgi:hypothetical protein
VKFGQDHHMPSTTCPNCRKGVDGATSVDADAKPGPGDITVCLYCGHIMAFAADLSLRELTDDEMRKVAGDKRILAIQWARGEAAKKRPR